MQAGVCNSIDDKHFAIKPISKVSHRKTPKITNKLMYVCMTTTLPPKTAVWDWFSCNNSPRAKKMFYSQTSLHMRQHLPPGRAISDSGLHTYGYCDVTCWHDIPSASSYASISVAREFSQVVSVATFNNIILISTYMYIVMHLIIPYISRWSIQKSINTTRHCDVRLITIHYNGQITLVFLL